MMNKFKFLLLFLLISSTSVLGSVDTPHNWNELKFSINEYGDEIHVYLKVDEEKLINVKLVWNKKEYIVAVEELEKIESPKMETLQIKYGVYTHGLISNKDEEYKIVKMNFGKKKYFNEFPSVEFHFYKGRYQFQLVTVKTGDAVFQDYRKNPGEEWSIAGKSEPF